MLLLSPLRGLLAHATLAASALVIQHRSKMVALDLSRVPDIEYSALQMLGKGDNRTTKQGATLWLNGYPCILAWLPIRSQ